MYINLDRLQYSGEYVLSVDDSITLRSIAESNAAARSYARSLFSLLTGIDIEDADNNPPGYNVTTSVNSLGNEKKQLFHIRPNPVLNEMHIQLHIPITEGMRMSFVNLLGDEKSSIPIRSTSIDISTAHLSPGIYIARLYGSNHEQIATEKIIVIK